MTEATATPNADPEAAAKAQFAIRKIYVKDISFEAPNSPIIFAQTVSPTIDINLGANSEVLDNGDHEVVVHLNINAKDGDRTIFLVELQQAGIFHLENVPDDQIGWVLGVSCPNVLFPYARQLVSDLTIGGGFPPLVLSPVNFESLYRQHQKQGNELSGSEQLGSEQLGSEKQIPDVKH